MAVKLAKADEIAVDLEHHDHRTYLGITCLMQISTREEDWIVDTIVLRNDIGDALRHVFDNPDIIKVLHGADRDVEWLQRDFGIYVVNMFGLEKMPLILSPTCCLSLIVSTTKSLVLVLTSIRQVIP